MRTINYTLLLILFAFSNLSFSQSSNPQVDSVIHAFMTEWDLPGGQFTMAYNNRIIYSKGYGYANRQTFDSVNTESLFRIASCTKPFTSVGIMRLIQDHQLHLDDKVFGPTGILNQPQYQNILDSQVLEITIENLLTHTAGWDDYYQIDPMFASITIAEWANIPSPPDQEVIVEYVLSQMKLINKPGTVYAYSNFGYCVLGRVIEKVAQMKYGDYIEEYVLTPSNIHTMKLGKSLLSGRFPNEVHYYGCPGEEIAVSVYDTNAIVPWPYGGFDIEAMDSHGDWIASTNDLVKFLFAVHEDRLLSQEMYNIMTTPPYAVDSFYAKGWGVNAGNIFHVGSLPGTMSEIVKATNGYIWALVFNKRDTSDQIFVDLDDLGWTIQKFLQPPVIDTCLISGQNIVTIHTRNVYESPIHTNAWHLHNYDGAHAVIDSAANHIAYVNAGADPGRYTIYKMGGDSNATVLCSLSVTVERLLPVELISFKSEVNERNVKLHWTTSSENENAGFDIERFNLSNANENSWMKLGFVSGRGNLQSNINYEFTDRSLSSGRYKYRLKQIDFNGNYQYHELSNEVFVGTPGKYFLSANYPNPFNPVTKINFDIPVSGKIKLTVFDIQGREVSTIINDFKAAGYYTVSFDASTLSSGVYFYKLEAGDFVMARKMVVLK